MSEIDDLTSQIRALFGDAPESNPLFREMAKKLAADSEKPKRVIAKKQPPVTIYTEVERVHRCTHCGIEWHSTVKLTKMDTVPFLDENGKVGVITSKSPAVVYCYSGFCDFCRNFVETLSREELVERYLYLLSNFPFPQVHGLKSYVQKMNTANTHEGEEVILSDAKI